jgi:hypothetical protein
MLNAMNESFITTYITTTFPDVETAENFGYTFFFYRSDHMLPFATLAAADNEYDRVSNLDRPGVYRLNLGVSRETFQALFGAAKVDVSAHDYTALDVVMPHPDYSPQHFICILAPSAATWEQQVRAWLAEAYALAVRRFNRRSQQAPA